MLKSPKVILFEQLRQMERHDEWLLDEALAETFGHHGIVRCYTSDAKGNLV